MIDYEQLQRDVDAAQGNLLIVTKPVMAEIVADLKSGATARRRLAREIAFGDVCSTIQTGAEA